jgi:DNA-binding transcriptional MocR family regulator
VVSFAEAMPEPETYPLREIGEAVQRALGSREALDYGPIQGDPELRNQMSRLLRDRGVEIEAGAMLVTAGAQQGIDLVLRGLVDQRDVILVEEPTYPGVLETAAQQGRCVVGIPRGESGFDMDALEAACRTYRPALLYVIPTFGNPTGTSLPPDQCHALLELARTHDLLILEDDVYGFLALDGPAGPPLKSRDTDGRVIYLTSLSKVVAPSLRLGIIAASDAQLPAVADAKQGVDLVCSMLLQRTVAEYLRIGQMQSHLEHVRALYRERRDAMLGALELYLPGCTWTRPAGGLSLWVTLPEIVDERDFIRDAVDEGVRVAPGRAFVPQARRRASMRLSYGMQTPERIDDGVRVLGGVLRRHVDRQRILSVAGRAVGPLV